MRHRPLSWQWYSADMWHISKNLSAKTQVTDVACQVVPPVSLLASVNQRVFLHWSWNGIDILPIQILRYPEGWWHVYSLTAYGSVPQWFVDVSWLMMRFTAHVLTPVQEFCCLQHAAIHCLHHWLVHTQHASICLRVVEDQVGMSWKVSVQ